MKIICEVPLGVKQYDQSQFDWLAGRDNYLFGFEDGRRLRMFSVKQEAGLAQEVQSAALAERRLCTSLSWNRDQSLLALVVDKRQIYFWEVKHNNFVQFKSRSVLTASQTSHVSNPANISSGGGGGRKSNKSKDIEFVAWSKLSDKLVVCFASGQLLLCKATLQDGQYTSVWERFVDNSESLLKRIQAIEVSEQAEVFACFSVTAEILIMTFEGQTKFYNQGDRSVLLRGKFSHLHSEHCPRSGQFLGQTIWFAYESENEDGLHMKKIPLDSSLCKPGSPPELQAVNLGESALAELHGNELEVSLKVGLVEFHWLNSSHLLLCLSSGSIQLVQLSCPEDQGHHQPPLRSTAKRLHAFKGDETSTLCTELVRIDPSDRLDLEDDGTTSCSSGVPASSQRSTRPTHRDRLENRLGDNKFKAFELIRTPKRGRGSDECFALAAATNYKLYYYELCSEPVGRLKFSIEHLDDIDLSESLKRVGLKLERIRWSRDCSMLSLQLTSGHLLVYRTCLEDLMASSHGCRAAYLSSANEVTILNYGASTIRTSPVASPPLTTVTKIQEDRRGSQETINRSARQSYASGDHAIILNVRLKPSLLAIGPHHLAVALNNRVRFYSLLQTPEAESLFEEQEYVTIVTSISLSSRLVAVHFDDGRLKLHPIRWNNETSQEDDDDDDAGERFFPDPSQPEIISSFVLTEELLVYSTRQLTISIFSLKSWSIVQVCDHSTSPFVTPVRCMKPNQRGNKFACLLEADSSGNQRVRAQQDGAFLYDLYSNAVFALVERKGAEDLWPKLIRSQVESTFRILPLPDAHLERLLSESKLLPLPRPKRLSSIMDAVWDTDGRTLLLTESKAIHVFAVLNHTLAREEPICEYVATTRKPSSYTTIFVSQGIVASQTSLGRVINLVLETHDDDLKLTELEDQIQAIRLRLATAQIEEPHQTQSENGSRQPETRAKDGTSFLEAHLKVTLLKLAYLCTILPIYSLPKCRDICKHLMDDQLLNLDTDGPSRGAPLRLVDQMIWKILAAWSLHTLNLDFASLTYKQNNLLAQATLLSRLQDDIRTRRLDSRVQVTRRVLRILGCEDFKISQLL